MGLGEVVAKVAAKYRIRVLVVNREILKDGCDLLADQPFSSDPESAKRGEVHGFHSGFPCSSFSMVRFRPGGPPPVRDRNQLMGWPNNNKAQNVEALRGNWGCLVLSGYVSCHGVGSQTASWDATTTLENPDDPVTEPLPSAWLIRQLQD